MEPLIRGLKRIRLPRRGLSGTRLRTLSTITAALPIRSAKKLPVPGVLVAAVLTLWLAAACATAPVKDLPRAAAPEGDLKTYKQIRSALDKNGETID